MVGETGLGVTVVMEILTTVAHRLGTVHPISQRRIET